MKKLLKVLIYSFLSILSLLIVVVIIFASILFYNPTFFINSKNLNFALKKTKILKSWSWKKGEINHEWIAWNHRHLTGSFVDLCIEKETPGQNIQTCMEEVSWNLDLTWKAKTGFEYTVFQPLVIKSKVSNITILKETKKESSGESPPDVLSYWDILWKPIVPDMNFNFQKINILSPNKKPIHLDLALIKRANELTVKTYGYQLLGTKNKISVNAPKKILIPMDLKTTNPLYFDELKLVALINKSNIPLTVTAKIENAILNIKSSIDKDFIKKNHSKAQIMTHVLLNTNGTFAINKLVKTIEHSIRPPYNILPAPINSMEGDLLVTLNARELNNKKDNVLINILTSLNLTGTKQALILDLKSDLPVDLNNFKIGPIELGLDLKKVALLLPTFSKTKLPPQMMPDSRFQNVVIKLEDRTKKTVSKKAVVNKKIEYKMNLEAIGDNALSVKTNLLDEILRLNFKLAIEDKKIKKGFIQTFPLKTTVFKRPITVTSLRINFEYPLEPELIATIEFHLPEYLITLKLNGPLSKPRQAFSSVPPLPQDDIFAVLLFGRPLSALNADDKSSAAGANKILSQGILSLAVLYYFAGSPIESLGYDPDSKAVTAQFGLGAKNSLQLTSEKGGANTAGIRHSLGKGWYIESSIGSGSKTSNSSDYGVLLERIKSY